MKRILMTGGTGFLGSHLLARLLEQEGRFDVTVLKRSSSSLGRIKRLCPRLRTFDADRQPLEALFDGPGYDVVLHCATSYGRAQTQRSEIIEANLLLPIRLLEIGLKRNLQVFLNTDTMLDKHVSAYTLSKRQFREWLQVLSKNIVGVNIALEHFYGPHDDPTKFVSYVIGELLAGKPSIPLTEGMQKRDFVYIDDVVDAFLRILDYSLGLSPSYAEFEIGSGISVPVRTFVEMAKKLAGNTGTRLDFGAVPFRSNEPMDVRVDTSLLRVLGWTPRWTLRDGLRETIRAEKARACAI